MAALFRAKPKNCWHGGSMLKGFREFVMRGNVIDLAVAVVIGAAVTAFVGNILTPLLAAVVATPDFSALMFKLNGSEIKIGLFLNALISFLLIAAAVYFAMVAPMNAWKARLAKGQAPAEATTKTCPACLESVALGARKCKWCGEEQTG